MPEDIAQRGGLGTLVRWWRARTTAAKSGWKCDGADLNQMRKGYWREGGGRLRRGTERHRVRERCKGIGLGVEPYAASGRNVNVPLGVPGL